MNNIYSYVGSPLVSYVKFNCAAMCMIMQLEFHLPVSGAGNGAGAGVVVMGATVVVFGAAVVVVVVVDVVVGAGVVVVVVVVVLLVVVELLLDVVAGVVVLGFSTPSSCPAMGKAAPASGNVAFFKVISIWAAAMKRLNENR